MKIETLTAGRLRRRDLLQAGGLGLLGTPLLTTARAEPSSASLPNFGRAKRCLVLYIYGAWSQLDTFDPKPEAPENIRGEFHAIDTKLPGVRVCEHLSRSAKVLDRCTLVRSMSHPWNIHSASYTLTGGSKAASEIPISGRTLAESSITAPREASLARSRAACRST